MFAGVVVPAAVWRSDDLTVGVAVEGPLLVIGAAATTWVAPGWVATRHASDCLLLRRVC